MIELLFSDPLAYLMMAVSIMIAFGMHEYSHAQMADVLGDSTARSAGRLTVNPLAHFDPFGALMLFLVGFGWGKPVPFNPLNLRNRRWGSGLVGLAGPASNFILAIIVGLVFQFFPLANSGLVNFFATFVWLNIMLGVFNLIPVPPLDGSHLLVSFFPSLGEKLEDFFLAGGVFTLLAAIIFMMYVGTPFIVQPLFSLITGLRVVF